MVDILCPLTTAAAAGAVGFIHDQRLVSSLNPRWCCRPGGEAFCFFSVFCGLNFRVHSCEFVVLSHRSKFAQ